MTVWSGAFAPALRAKGIVLGAETSAFVGSVGPIHGGPTEIETCKTPEAITKSESLTMNNECISSA